MSKTSLILAAVCLTAFFTACQQANPTLINSTSQPRDNRQVTNHSETNHGNMNVVSTNSTGTNSGMTNANSTNHTEMKPESRTNSGN